MWWMTLALAAPPLSHGWNLADRGCYEDTLALAGEALAEAPEDAGWHRLRQYALQRQDNAAYVGHSQRLDVMAMEHPDHPGLAVARASAALWPREVDCKRVSEILDKANYEDDASRYEVLRLRIQAAGRCEEDDSAYEQELRSLSTVPQATSLALQWDLSDDARSVAVEDLQRELAGWPARGEGYARALFGDEKGPAPLRKALLAAAEGFLDSDDPYELYVAGQILESAGKKLPDGLEGRLQEVLPCTERARPAEARADRSWRYAVYKADKRPTHEAGLASLRDLEKKVPERPIDRVYWLRRILKRELALGLADEAYATERSIARLLPDDGEAVNSWAYDAATRGEDLDEALEMLEAVLAARPEPVYEPGAGEGFGTFRDGYHRQTSDWEDTHGWLLHRLGRHDEAAAALDRALMARQSGVVHAHMGLVQVALGQDDLAFEHLREAFVMGVNEGALTVDARAAIAPLAQARGAWHPAGLEAWVDVLGAEEEELEAAAEGKEAHPLLGQAFPISEAEGLGGGQVPILGTGATATVVVVWATWCGPCIAGMPHLQEVAAGFADGGVQVIGLSVDKNKGAAKRFYKGTEVAYGLAWFGETGFSELQITGIPSLFVLDGDGVVTHKITGYGDGDTRVEEALEEVLAAAGAPKPE